MAVLKLHDTSNTAVVVFSPAEEGLEVPNPRFKTKLFVDNQGATDITVTAPATSPSSCGYLHDLEETVEAGAVKCISLPKALNNKSGQVPITFSDTTTVTVAAIE